MAVEAGLTYVSDSEPWFRRLRVGKGFTYLAPGNRRLSAAKELKRISSLAIPPAYRDVWICTQARGHLQATGRDARGRKQYRYHPQWRQVRDGAKFDRMVTFGEALPKLRRRLKKDLALPGLPREKVLAVVVSLLDTTRARVGNAEYARDNNSFGLTTLRNRHVSFASGGRALNRALAEVVKEVAAQLRNTPAVCRRSYINPAAFDAWKSGTIHETFNGHATATASSKAEKLVLVFLRRQTKAS